MNPENIIGQRYTGPFISNNKFQTSVLFGDQAPVDALDSNSRLHDTSRAYFGPGIERKAADSLYNERVSKLPGALPTLAGKAVLYGNSGLDSLGNLTSRVATGFKYGSLPGAFVGLVYGGLENMYDLHNYILHEDEAKAKVKALERLDPYPQFQLGSQTIDPSSTMLKGIQPKGIANGLKVEPRPSSPATTPISGSVEPASTSATSVYKPSNENDVLSSVSPSTQWLGGGEYQTMVKNQKQKKTMVVAVRAPKAPKATPAKAKRASRSMGAITTINTAPVAIGNSIQGSESVIVASGKNGVILRGRDFMFAPIGTGTVSTWTMCGGTPLSPAAFADTTMANYMRLYAKFRIRELVVHYITSSATSSSGDVMFYYGKDRSSVFLNQTSTQLLGFVLSDKNTIIGPQWMNHSARLTTSGEWKLTDYGMHDGIAEYADGELFLLSKTSTSDSPGYVLFDYVVEFAEHQLQPRLLEFPIPRCQYWQTNLGLAAVAPGLATPVNSVNALTILGNNISGSAAAAPASLAVGDVYKVILDVTNSNTAAWVLAAVNDLFSVRIDAASSGTKLTVVDGMTLYAVVNNLSNFDLFTTCTAAFAEAQATNVVYARAGVLTFNLQCWISYVGSVGVKNLVPNY